jgi:ATP-binding cassette, subfamily A (ABC1), member 3
MTAREHLHMYAAFKGIDRKEIPAMVTSLIDKLGLTQYADRPCGGYSGGNRRKLSVGIALIGNPPLVFLGEKFTTRNHHSDWDQMNHRLGWIRDHVEPCGI